jgi:hypothetical protein
MIRRVLYHAAINVALPLGYVQARAVDEMRAHNRDPRLLTLPWALASLAVWCVFRPAFVLTTRLTFALAVHIPIEQREKFRP